LTEPPDAARAPAPGARAAFLPRRRAAAGVSSVASVTVPHYVSDGVADFSGRIAWLAQLREIIRNGLR
jgi:hypothetical protein